MIRDSRLRIESSVRDHLVKEAVGITLRIRLVRYPARAWRHTHERVLRFGIELV
jgi:hypothetical protein